ncbi:MAG: DNA-binding domain-containing protein [Gammaproteobacteria bacterium]|nr:DNA-binding domain-containing protein [Gammaproteobacteria bacterium]
MPSLAELQDGFARALRDPGSPLPNGLRDAAPGGSSRRFDVYRNNMVVSLVEALGSTFPAVQRLVGEEYFSAAARAYVQEAPPDSPVLLYYGRTFGDFLDALPSASGVPYLGDVARLEWARIKALHAADAEPASIEALAGVNEARLESITFTLQSGLSVIRSHWPVVSLWNACMNRETSEEVDMSTPEAAVVVRPALKVGVHVPPPGGAEFLAALREGATLGAAAGRAMDSDESFDLAGLLRFVFETGAVTAVHSPEEQAQP